MTVRVLLADDQELIRRGFRMILEEQAEITVVGEAADGDEAVRLTRELHPDVVLMDVRMPGTDGIDATRRIVAESPEARVLVLTTYDLDEYAFSALRYGASGFLLKDARPAELADAIRAVASGDAVVAPSVTRRLLDAFAGQLPDLRGRAGEPEPPGLDLLTEREREVLVQVAGGLSNREVAAALFVTEATVKSHLSRILSKLGLRDRAQAVVFAYQVGLVHPGDPGLPHPGDPGLPRPV
jgi:DNA-binding NarL/FixJ family response regulator